MTKLAAELMVEEYADAYGLRSSSTAAVCSAVLADG